MRAPRDPSAPPPSPRIGATYSEDLSQIPPEPPVTPFFHPMGRTLDAILAATAVAIARLAGPTTAVSVACDEAMNSEDPVLARTGAGGFLADCTDRLEEDRARRLGWPASRIVLSGAAKFWPGGFHAPGACALFCDSLGELDTLTGHIRRGEKVAEYVGATLRLAEYESRIGIPVSATEGLEDLCSRLSGLPAGQKLALEIRADAGRIGIDRWKSLGDRFLDLASLVGLWIGRPIACLGLAGVWDPEDWIFALDGPIAQLTARIARTMPGVSLVILDSGRAFRRPAHSLIARVIDVRRGPVAEVIVDASIAELPDAEDFVHRIAWRSARARVWRPVSPGQSWILGRRHCERDVLMRRLAIPEELLAGDLLAFCDAGGEGLRSPQAGF